MGTPPHRASKILAATAVIGSLLTAGAAVATPAEADASCSGSITYSRTVNDRSGTLIGELVIYYNTSNGGTNSACFRHRGVSYGVAAPTAVRIFRCAERSGEGQSPCTVTAQSSVDTGNYKYYAGPRGVTGTANNCVWASAYIYWQGVRYDSVSNRQGC